MKKKNRKTKTERRIEKELVWIIGFLLFLVVLYFIAGAFFKSFNYFEYKGLSFTKERYGELPVYRHYYYYQDQSGKVIQYNLFLHHDPRANNVSFEGSSIFLEQK